MSLQFSHSERGDALALSGTTPLVLEPPSWFLNLCAEPPVPTAITSADGSFEIMAPNAGSVLHVEVDGQALHSGVLQSLESGQGQELRVSATAQVRGTVTDSQGEPVVGAEVLAGSYDPAASLVVLHQRARTNRDGGFLVSGLRPGPSLIAVRRDAQEPFVMVSVDPADPESLEVTLGSAARLEVRGQSDAGETLALTEVEIIPGWTEDWIYLSRLAPRAAWSARRSFAGVPGAAETGNANDLSAEVPAGTYGVLARSNAAAGFASAQVDPESTGRVLVEMQEVRDLEVQVIDRETGLAVEGAAVTVVGWRATQSDWRGRAVLEDVCVTGNRAWFGVDHPAFVLKALNLADIELEAQPPHLTLTLERGAKLRLDVLNEGLVPEQPLLVTLTPLESLAGAVGLLTLPRVGVPDDQGSVLFTGLEPGPYELAVAPHALQGDLLERIAAVGMNLFHAEALTTTSVVLEPRSTARRRLDLKTGWAGSKSWLRGVVRVDGQAMAKAEVGVAGQGGYVTFTRPDGSFDLGELEPGVAWVLVDGVRPRGVELESAPWFRCAVVLKPGEGRLLNLDLWTTRVGILVRGAQGEVLENATVRLEASGPRIRIRDQDTTGKDGRVELHSFVSTTIELAERLELFVSAQGHHPRDLLLQIPSGANFVRKEVRLKPVE